MGQALLTPGDRTGRWRPGVSLTCGVAPLLILAAVAAAGGQRLGFAAGSVWPG